MNLRGHRNLAAFAASKGGIAQLTKVLAKEWAPEGRASEGRPPGYLETGLTRGYLGDPAVRSAILAKIPPGRIGGPADVVGALLFLASSLAAYGTGAILFVDGGRTVDYRIPNGGADGRSLDHRRGSDPDREGWRPARRRAPR